MYEGAAVITLTAGVQKNLEVFHLIKLREYRAAQQFAPRYHVSLLGDGAG